MSRRDPAWEQKAPPTVAPIDGKVARRKSAAHHRVEEGQEPTKRRECAGDVGAPENQAEEPSKIHALGYP